MLPYTSYIHVCTRNTKVFTSTLPLPHTDRSMMPFFEKNTKTLQIIAHWLINTHTTHVSWLWMTAMPLLSNTISWTWRKEATHRVAISMHTSIKCNMIVDIGVYEFRMMVTSMVTVYMHDMFHNCAQQKYPEKFGWGYWIIKERVMNRKTLYTSIHRHTHANAHMYTDTSIKHTQTHRQSHAQTCSSKLTHNNNKQTNLNTSTHIITQHVHMS